MDTSINRIIKSYKNEINRLTDLVNLYRYDFLTGLKMRRDYFKDLESSENKWLTIIDINGLHNINRHPDGGYEAGDKLIKDTVKCLVNTAKSTNQFSEDNLYRIGGDEFAIISNSKIEHLLTNIPNITFASERIINNTDYFELIDKKIKTKKRLLYKNSERRSN